MLERVKRESPEAWHRLTYLFHPVVYHWCLQGGLQPADAGDVAQDVFCAVLKQIRSFRREQPGDTFRGWLCGITKNKLADFWKHHQNHPNARGGSDALEELANHSARGEPPDPEPPGSLYRRGLKLIQEEFQEWTWKAFWRVAVDGQSPADVADELGMSVNAVYIAKSRVLRRLRQELGDLLD